MLGLGSAWKCVATVELNKEIYISYPEARHGHIDLRKIPRHRTCTYRNV